MDKHRKLLLVLLLTLALAGVYWHFAFSEKAEEVPATTIASWNLHVFGQKKASNETLMSSYAAKLSDYDIVFVQEIRDKSNTSFWKLCELMPQHECVLSSRAGRSSSKEQYGLLYKNAQLVQLVDYNPDSADRWERPPVKAQFSIQGYNLTIYNIHTKPGDTRDEIVALEELVSDELGNVLIIGDLNADCSYYRGGDFKRWKWLIKSDTTVGRSDCAYDRTIVNKDAKAEVKGYGVDIDVTAQQSDHYLVWVMLGK